MEKQQLLDLGLDEEIAKQVLVIHAKDIQSANAKTATAEQERDGLKEQIGERDKQLKELQKNVGDNEELQAQIKSLQDSNSQVAKDYEAKLEAQAKDFQIENALVGAGAKSVKAVKALLNLDDVKVNGDKVEGLEDQLNGLKDSDGYLFKEEEPTGNNGPQVQITGSGNPSGGGKGSFDISKASYKEALAYKQEHPDEFGALNK